MPSEGSCGHRGSGPEGELRRKGTRNAVCPVGSPRSGEPAPRRERRSDGGKGRSDRGRDSKTAEIGQRHGAVGRGGAADTRLALAWEKTASSGRASRQCVGGTGQVVSGEMQSAVITQQRRGADHTPSSGPGQADSTALLSGGRCPRGRHLQGGEASGTRGKSRGRWGSGGTCSPGGGRAGQHRRGGGSGGRPWLGRGPARGRRGPPAAAWLSRAPASPSGADVQPSGCRKVLSGWASPDHLAKVPAQSEKAASARKPGRRHHVGGAGAKLYRNGGPRGLPNPLRRAVSSPKAG